MSDSPETLEPHSSPEAVTDVGTRVGEVSVSIGARFLQLFSEQLYTSPNKAFEELVSNSWDAGASLVHIGIPDDLSSDDVAVWVLDNGESMDLDGLKLLWAVADDHKTKPGWPRPAGRDQIGMFGIGKLATYVLADEVTYVCRDAAGVIRAVTVDYREIQKMGENELHVSAVPFAVRLIEDAELPGVLNAIDPALANLLAELVVTGRTVGDESDDDEPDGAVAVGAESESNAETDGTEAETAPPAGEYHDDTVSEPVESPETWTLAVLTSLKDRGRKISKPIVRNVLRSSLPLEPSIQLVIDGAKLESTKLDIPLISSPAVLGEDFVPEKIKLEGAETEVVVKKAKTPSGEPALEIDGLPGLVTGEIKLYEKSIGGGRSAERARSNGFFVNVLGRVINLPDEYFGLPPLSHSSWAKLRVTVRADGLNESLSVSRETVEETEEVRLVRSLLRAAFNFARGQYDEKVTWPSLTEILTDEWGTVPLTPLLNAVDRAVDGDLVAGVLVDVTDVVDPQQAMKELHLAIATTPGNTLTEVKAERLGPESPLAVYQLAKRRVLINSDHPYYVEQITGDHDPEEILQTGELISLLSDAYLLELGVTDAQVVEVRNYRDKVGRLIARARRKSAPQLAHMLLESTTDQDALELMLRDCLEWLGFDVQHQAQSGKPEGIATADLAPGPEGVDRRYRLVYEAKSTTDASGKVDTKDVYVSGQDRHRRHAAGDTDDATEVEYALVVAPGFRVGALEDECAEAGVCPMRATDLARLLMGVAATGPLDLEEFETILQLHDPDEVAKAVDKLITAARDKVGITVKELIEALALIDNVDQLSTATIAEKMRGSRTDGRPKEVDVQALMKGLAMLVPAGIQIIGNDRVVLGTTPERLAEAVRVQAALLPDAHRFDLDDLPELKLIKT